MNPTDKITVELERQQWVAVCNVMAEAPVPYRTVAPLLNAIGAALIPAGVPRANGAAQSEDDHAAAE
jgi:hypothetical protein